MRTLDLSFFAWMGAGFAPNPQVLHLALFIAQNGAAAGILLLVWAGWRKSHDRFYMAAIVIACGVAAMLAHTLAGMTDMPRPFVLGLTPAYTTHGARGSFPSTHAMVMSTAAAALLVRPSLAGIGLGMTVLALLTAWARIYVGLHFPTDVAVGFVFGALIGGAVAGVYTVTELLVNGRGSGLHQRRAKYSGASE